MPYLLFIFYFLLLLLVATRSSIAKNAGLTRIETAILFSIKIAAGLALGFLMQKIYAGNNDFWSFNSEGKAESALLLSDPAAFVRTTFSSNYSTYGSFFGSSQSYWNDLRGNLLIKLLAVFSVFSGGNYYINSLFLNFFVFSGHLAVFAVFTNIFPRKKWLVITGCFLLPSCLYFTSGIGRDALVFTGLAWFIYSLYFLLTKPFVWKRAMLLIFSFLLVLLIRNFVAMLLLPASLALWASYRSKLKPLYIFLFVYATATLLIVALQIIAPKKNPLHIISDKQQAFFELPKGNTYIATDTLQPTLGSIAVNSPQAMNHVLMRPYVTETNNGYYFFLATELLIYYLLFILMLLFFEPPLPQSKAFINFSIFFSLTVLVFIGLIVPNIGAIVRYRSLYLPWLITPVLCSTNGKKLLRFLNIKI